MERQLDAYCAHLRNERQVSSHTLEAYRRDLNKVLAYCEKLHIGSWSALDIQRLRGLVLDGLWMQVGDPAAIAEAEAGLR